MDFITKTPKSQGDATDVKYRTILVTVDRLPKYAHFILCKTKIPARALELQVIDMLIGQHAIPRLFVTDTDKLFTSNY